MNKLNLYQLEKQLLSLEDKYNKSTGREVYRIGKQIAETKRLIALAKFNY